MSCLRDAKPLLVGELNPYGADPEFALYPAPDGCSGHRLCCLILGMQRRAYLDSFDRVNLCSDKWSLKQARQAAYDLFSPQPERRFILLGSKVCSAFGVDFKPFVRSEEFLILPHPSGLCRLWNEVNAVAMARAAVLAIAPELVGKIGEVDGKC